ncbi:putative reverse transcriptase domain-containing protein [Tanacetum coccineum]|uniref:Reverse transcriptase domain-containing protein n=1 Tax=Tanacetum coccineum TaxID=301880 RepID=A0ABQ5HJM6_9ASTR
MAPKRRTTRLNPSATPTPVTDTHTTTSVTNAQIQAMINEGVTAALAARDQPGMACSHTSRTCQRPVQWFEKMESIYSISNYTVACHVKFAMCTLQGNALSMEQPEHNQNKRQNTGRAYAAGNGDRRPYGGPKPLNPPNIQHWANQRACFECGAQGHFKMDCPKLKNNNNRGNQVRNAKAQAKVYAVGNAGANPDNNVVTALELLSLRLH